MFWERAVEAVDAGRPRKVEIDCVELHRANYDELCKEIADLNHDGVSIRAHHGSFADEATRKATELAGRKWIPPVFWTADPYGFAGVPLDVIRKLMALPRSEVMITFMVREMRRFLGQENFDAPLDEFFGGDSWRECVEIDAAEDREQKLLLTYSDLIRSGVAKFATPFRVFEDERSQTVYYLVHLTNEPLGMRKMKEAMVKQSPDMTFWPVTRRDPKQLEMDVAEGAPYPSLQKHLVKRFHARTLSFEDVLNEDYPEGLWVEGEYRKAILHLEKRDQGVAIERRRDTPSKREPSGLKEPDMVSFARQMTLV